MTYLLILISLFLFELLYFKIADKFNIIDKPNERSSHTGLIIRGGGVVFFAAGMVYFVKSGFAYPYFFAGLILISVLSFLDDLFTLTSKIRLPLQLLSVFLLVYQIMGANSWWVIIALVMATGIINAYNFMDGINGITGVYSAVLLLSLIFINRAETFIDIEFLYISFLGVMVFNFFNFRKTAKCFAGDVGSMSIAMIVVFATFTLMYKTQSLWYILLLAVYGVDSVLTIVYRLRKRENIFEAHRSHLYQWLVKPGPFSHLQMAAIYGVVQLGISAIVIYYRNEDFYTQISIGTSILISLGLTYIFIKKYYVQKFNIV